MPASMANDSVESLDHEFSDDVEFLAAFSQFFAVSRDLMATLETALAGIVQGLHAEAGALFLLDEGGSGELVCQAAVGPMDLRGACLVEALQTARSNSGDLGLVSVSTQAMRVLELARLDMVFAIHDNLDSALTAGA